MVEEWCQELKVNTLNTRLIKKDDNEYHLRISSVEFNMFKNKDLKKDFVRDGIKLRIMAEDHKWILDKVYYQLRMIFKYAKDK